MSRAVRDAVAGWLRTQVPGRTVYAGDPPTTGATSNYLVVRANLGDTTRGNLADRVDQRSPTLWVTSVGSHPDPKIAEDAAMWGAEKAWDALTGWRPVIGQATWKPAHLVSQPPQRDDALPDVAVVYVVDQWSLIYQP